MNSCAKVKNINKYTMKTSSPEPGIILDGMEYRKHVLLADANIPCKFSIDRKRNNLFFCINADDFSDQSFQSVVMNLDKGLTSIIPGIHNGFASAVDQNTGDIFLGGSDGIFKYSYSTNDIVSPALINGIDIFDMYFHDNLYFVDTPTQNLHLYKDNKSIVVDVKGDLIEHFVIDVHYDLYYVNSSGLFVLSKGKETSTLLDRNHINIRGATTDIHGKPFFIASDGIYSLDKETKLLAQILSVKNGNGLAFDMNNNMIYSEYRSVFALRPK